MSDELTHLKELILEKFAAIDQRFKERDARFALEFAAQKDAVAKQEESNAKAIDKAQTSTVDTINKLTELFKTTTDGLRDKIDDVKANVNGISSVKQGGMESGAERRAVLSSNGTLVAMAVGLIVVVLALYAAFHSTTPTVVPTITTPTQTVTVTTP